MNKKDKIDAQNRLAELVEINNGLKAKIAETPVENGLEEFNKLDKEISENAIEIIKIENSLKDFELAKAKGTKQLNFLETNNSVSAFFDVLQNNGKKDVMNAWNAKLAENDITITDSTLQLPRKLVESIQTSLTDTNPVFKVFRVTNIGAMIVSSLFSSDDEAQVHTIGADKTMQAATLDTSAFKPQIVYKLQAISEYIKRLNVDYNELYALVVAELTQAIVNKVVDLALLEGTATGTNGFISVALEPDAKKIKKITATAGDPAFSDAVEDAVDFVRRTAGTRYLIVTVEQRRALLNELRALPANAHVRIKNDDAEIASEVGVDELIVYTGKKSIKPTVLVQDAYHVDMQDLTKVDAFEWKNNENIILVESLSAGHTEKLNAGAVITLPAP
jgi:DNA-binding protein Fis